jgi:hypothetical protein
MKSEFLKMKIRADVSNIMNNFAGLVVTNPIKVP